MFKFKTKKERKEGQQTHTTVTIIGKLGGGKTELEEKKKKSCCGKTAGGRSLARLMESDKNMNQVIATKYQRAYKGLWYRLVLLAWLADHLFWL